MSNSFILLQSAMTEEASDAASQVTNFLSNLGFGPGATKIIGGIAVLILGFILAKWVGSFIAKIVRKTNIDSKAGGNISISKMVGKLIYYIIMIIVLMTSLNIMGVGSEVLQPLNNMVNEFMSAIPNIIGAGIIIYAGYFLAKIISEFVEMAGDTIRNISPKLNLENFDLVKVIKNIVFIIIFIPVLIVGLDYLNFDVITDPAKEMLGMFLSSIPMILKAVAIIVVAYFGGKIISNLLRELLSSLKIDEIKEKAGLTAVLGNSNLSSMISTIVYIFIMYLAIMQALDILQLSQVSAILDEVIHVAGNVVMGLIIITLGNIVANFAVKIFSTENTSKFTAALLRGAIICIFLAMGLSAMNIADSIINLAFGLALGALAVAFALAFGLGGREVAAKEMQKFFDKFNN